ncbi:hypothetical protein RHECIAT_CH0004110 [Rhizobium etli CIAT 652]|nr:hypothetical protein RHECIAT_CH0004110 [Rhizobium etli CIAT 652]ANL93217.1 hypothetical protein AMC80_CH03997 [Rhizobium phaseoli]
MPGILPGMSITTPDDRISTYNPVVATTQFAATFPIFDNADLGVLVDDVERFDFTVTATYTDGISNDAKAVFSIGVTGQVMVFGKRAPRRSSRFLNGAPLPIRDQNLALDTLEAEMQEASRDIKRSVKVPAGSTGYSIFDDIADGSLLCIDGDEIKGGPSYAGITDAVSDAQQAAAAAELSEQAAAICATNAAASASASAGFAVAAAASQGQAQNLVDAAQAAYVGFQPGTFYDFGRVADPLELFPGDWGRVSDI